MLEAKSRQVARIQKQLLQEDSEQDHIDNVNNRILDQVILFRVANFVA